MTDLHITSAQQLATMDAARQVFDRIVTPSISNIVQRVPSHLRQAWWDGYLAATVDAMRATIGEQRTTESCTDLYTRAQDFLSDLKKAGKG